jgi:hypothetical protein
MKKWNLILAAAAGFLGGSLSHLAFPGRVEAQVPFPNRPRGSNLIPREIDAKSFVLFSQTGDVIGRFASEPGHGGPNITLYSPDHKVLWQARGPVLRPLAGQ